MPRIRSILILFLLLLFGIVLVLCPYPVLAQSFSITSLTPAQNALSVTKSANIRVTFSTDVNSSTLTNTTIRINGLLSGLHPATFGYNSGTRTATIDPNTDFQVGELVAVELTRGIKSTIGDSLASAYSWSFTVKVDSSTGVFPHLSTVGVGSNPIPVTAGDWNRDGLPDLAAANFASNTVSILLNNGSGSFSQSLTISVGGGPISVTAGDWNGDGYLDLAVANSNSSTVSILTNNGSGSFTQSSTVSVEAGPYSVTAGDWNGDGYLDLVVANRSSTVQILLNNGSGSFTQSSTPSVGVLAWSVTSGDFDGDGDIDLAVANYGSNTVSILTNNGSGSFTQSSTPSVGSNPKSMTAGDWNGDGYLDLAVANIGSNTVSILTNNGSGSFTQSSTPSVGSAPYSVTAGDLDGDGDLDLAVANSGSNTVSILTNNGSGSFTQSSTPSVGSAPYSVTAGDWNGDGLLDLATANRGSNTVSILYRATVTFTDGSTFSPPNANPGTDNNPIGRFKLTTLTTGATLSSVTISFSGIFTGVTGVNLWSSADSIFGSGTQIGSTQPYSTTVTFNGLSSVISTSGTYYFVILNLGASNGSVNAFIADNTAIIISVGMSTTIINNATLNSTGVVLPVEISSFTATSERSIAELRWKTETETNNYGFEIERRAISSQRSAVSDWQKIGFIQGNGTSNSQHEYSFSDSKSVSGRYAYRLKQVDNNGTFKYSQEVEIEIFIPKVFALSQNYPNPFNPSTTISFDVPTRSFVTLQVFDCVGREIATIVSEQLSAGIYAKQWNAENLPSGIYFYRLEAGSFVETKKLLLLK